MEYLLISQEKSGRLKLKGFNCYALFFINKMNGEKNMMDENSYWEIKPIQIHDSWDFNNYPQLLTNVFYISSYACPHCGKPMYKTVFPIGNEFIVPTCNGNIELKRVFTCPDCKYFVTAAINRLSDDFVYERQCNTQLEYQIEFKKMNDCGTTRGRPD